MSKAKYKIVPSDQVAGNWHIYRKSFLGWERITVHFSTLNDAQDYLTQTVSCRKYYDAKGIEITT